LLSVSWHLNNFAIGFVACQSSTGDRPELHRRSRRHGACPCEQNLCFVEVVFLAVEALDCDEWRHETIVASDGYYLSDGKVELQKARIASVLEARIVNGID
jgi:hypothetical protein